MGKRKGRRQSQKTLNNDNNNNNSNSSEDDSLLLRSEDLDEEKSESDGEFFGCYLLTSLCPRYKGHTYIGFTVNPQRRIRQHNGELCSGAFRTKKKRPWEMVLCIYGFPTNVAALQFEWAWQHPVESLAVRKAAVGFKSLGGLANKIKLAYTMLTLPSWNKLNLTVNFFSTKYTTHYAGCPTLPSHMRVHVRSMDELPCYTEGYKDIEDDLFKFENDLSGDEEETEKSGGSNDFEATVEDVTVSVSASVDHHNIEAEATCVSDTRNYKRPFCNDDLWDDEPEKSGGCRESQARFGDITMSVPVSLDNHTNENNAICVSDDENYELPSCINKSPGRLFVNIPESSFTTGSDYCGVTSPITGNKDGKKDCITDKDGPGAEISGPVEVIDVFTPSPEYRANFRRKKRAVSAVCPEVIDLTESPICV
uniref:structure-specific endonuclease subunit SLX1 homolog n=1 Tax=Erigeron canadensis TaxID=72917 RepID=UPI001CB8C06C|nr:structure-specific endonuclease subunit SLX1 homolog [Erigeron canadensis]